MKMAVTNTELTLKLNHLNNTLKQLRQFKVSRLSLIDPSSGQGKVLATLKEIGAIPQSDLVNQLGMSRQSASELIRKLEKRGLVNRIKSETDKRVFQVSLTEKGISSANRISVNEEDYMDALSDDDKATFDKILNTLIKETDSQYDVAKKNFGANIFGTKGQ
ncbi:hypothetical protein FC34_GL001072 [Lacticaseibacillus brantae DSM 23927]|uniref:HTH marR-type domain-containing protein n=2 Tax=Lacticaseibacillus brantae TaxID=943673 RepID=A0A0R2AXH7_9LACO|nr:hypothetical protein FC34_GL001072 [Lacticaseibacillus brantae DSM 23927]